MEVPTTAFITAEREGKWCIMAPRETFASSAIIAVVVLAPVLNKAANRSLKNGLSRECTLFSLPAFSVRPNAPRSKVLIRPDAFSPERPTFYFCRLVS